MSKRWEHGLAVAVVAVALLAPGAGAQSAAPARFWPQWRGPLGTGESTTAKPPLEWSEQKNIRWKLPLQGEGKSTPVVWGDLVFITSAVRSGGSAAPAPAPADRRRPAARRAAAGCPLRVRRPGGQSRRREGPLAQGRPHRAAPRGASCRRDLRVGIDPHRRPSRLRVLRLARALRARHERQPQVGETARTDADAQWIRRGQLAGAPRRQPARAVGPRGRRLHRVARRRDRQGTLAARARRADDVVHAACGGARGQAAGDRVGQQQGRRPTISRPASRSGRPAGSLRTSFPRPCPAMASSTR